MDFLNNYFLRPIGFGWATPDEVAQNTPVQQTKKRKLVDESERLEVTQIVPALNTATNTLPEPKVKRQKCTHEVEEKQPQKTQKNESLLINFADDTSEEEIMITEPKIVPHRLAQPQNIEELNQALLALEQYDSQGLIKLDMGDRSFRCLLLPLINGNYNQSDAWLSDFFIINFLKEKIASSGKGDILIYDFKPDNLNINLNMVRVANKNKDKNINKVIWSICHKQHFYLITIQYDAIKNTVYIYAFDGFNSIEQQKLYLEKANYFAEKFFPQAECYMEIPQKIVNQGNAMDCAVVACYIGNHFIKKTASEFQTWANSFSTPKAIEGIQKQPFTPYRKKIAEVLFATGNRMLQETVRPEQRKFI